MQRQHGDGYREYEGVWFPFALLYFTYLDFTSYRWAIPLFFFRGLMPRIHLVTFIFLYLLFFRLASAYIFFLRLLHHVNPPCLMENLLQLFRWQTWRNTVRPSWMTRAINDQTQLRGRYHSFPRLSRC